MERLSVANPSYFVEHEFQVVGRTAETVGKRNKRYFESSRCVIRVISISARACRTVIERRFDIVAADGDVLVDSVIVSIPKEAVTRGVFSELALRDRFLNVEQVAYRLANLPEGYASIPAILLSYLQSFLLIRQTNPISVAELANEKVIDVSSLSNYDILSRAR